MESHGNQAELPAEIQQEILWKSIKKGAKVALVTAIVLWSIHWIDSLAGLHVLTERKPLPNPYTVPADLEYQTAYAQYDQAHDCYRVGVPLRAEAVLVRHSIGDAYVQVPNGSVVEIINVLAIQIEWPGAYGRFGVWQDGAGEVVRGSEEMSFDTVPVMVKDLREYKQWKPKLPKEQFALRDDGHLGSVLMRVGDHFRTVYEGGRFPLPIPDDIEDRRLCLALNMPRDLRPELRGEGYFWVTLRIRPAESQGRSEK